MDVANGNHCHHESGERIRPGKRLVVVSAVFAGMVLLSFLPALESLNNALTEYMRLIWWAVALGLLIGGVIDYFVPDGLVIRYLGRPGHRSLINALVAGLAMAACSHGILAIAMQLYKKGASVPAVITFLLASPWANLPITLLLIGLFGFKALYFILGALLVALLTGIAYTALEKAGLVERNPNNVEPSNIDWSRIRNVRPGESIKGVFAGAVSLANRVLWWILIGVMLAALIGAYVPQHWFMQFLGPDLSGILATLLFATVIEVCSEGTSPIAFELYEQLGVLGNPFVFLLAGVATDYTEIGLIWSNIGKKAAIWLPVITVPQIVIIAVLLNTYIGG